MFLYVLVVDINEILKLFNHTHVFDPNISEKPFLQVTPARLLLKFNIRGPRASNIIKKKPRELS